MGSFTNTYEDKILNHILKNTELTQPTNIYLALSTADPTEDGSGISEPSGNGYARALVNTWNAASNRQTANTNDINFNTATGSWGTITHWALYDDLTAGNIIAHGSFNVSKTINAGNTAFCPAGALTVSFNSGGITTYLANKILDHIFKNTALTQFANLYVGLSTSNPGDSGSLAGEPSGNGYNRVLNNSWSVASGGSSSNSAIITFPTATGSWGTVTHGFIADASTSGNVLLYGSLNSSTPVTTNDVLRFNTSQLIISLD